MSTIYSVYVHNSLQMHCVALQIANWPECGKRVKTRMTWTKCRWYWKSMLVAKPAGNCNLWPPLNAICYVWMTNGKIGSMGLVFEYFQKTIEFNVLRFLFVIAAQGAAHQIKELLGMKGHSKPTIPRWHQKEAYTVVAVAPTRCQQKVRKAESRQYIV